LNIFVLHENPIENSKLLCNKHIVKMILESTQLLCNCFAQTKVPYKRTHYNHPCSIWVRESLDNFEWLKIYAIELCKEYTYRYNKVHKCEQIIFDLNKPKLQSTGLTEFKLAMPDQYKCKNAVQSYKQYYLGEKLNFCKWPIERVPQFIIDYCNDNSINIEIFYDNRNTNKYNKL
jgi:hypothetical protein